MMLIAPTYNQFLKKLNKLGFSIWILLLLVFGYTLGNLESSFHDLEKALFFYTLGAFVKDYLDNVHDKRRVSFLLFAIIGLILNGICQYGVLSFAIQKTGNAILFRKTFSMLGHLIAEPLACFGLFCLFLYPSFYNKKINWIAKHTFGIYLFHEVPVLRTLIWIYILQPWNSYGKDYYFIYIPVCVMTVFISGGLVDIFREKMLARLCNKTIDKLIKSFYQIGYR